MNVTPNIPRLFTALAEWCACLIFILRFPRRPGMSKITLPFVLLAALGVQILFLQAPAPCRWCTGSPAWGWPPCS